MQRFAAGGNTGAAIANILNKDGVDYSRLGARQIGRQAQEFADTINSNLMVGGANLDAAARIGAAEHWRDVQGEMAQNQYNSELIAAGIDAGGQIGLGAISKFGGGGGWKDASSIGFAGNQVNSLGRLRY